MTKKMRVTLAVLGAVVLGQFVLVAQTPGVVKVYGVGSLTCNDWTIKDAQPVALHYVQLSWVEGFISAIHNYTGTLKEIDRAQIDPWITDYCQRHPVDSIA